VEVSSWSSSVTPRKRLDISSSGGEIRLHPKRRVRCKLPRSQLKTYYKKKPNGIISEDHNLFFTYVQTANMTETYYLKCAFFLRVTIDSLHSVNEVFALPGRYVAQIRSYQCFGKADRSHFQGSSIAIRTVSSCDCLTLKDGTISLSRNVGY
jgi:hypothetical protein